MYNTYGDGRCVYIAAPVEKEFRKNRYSWFRTIYADALRRVLPNPRVEVLGPLSIVTSLMKREGRLIIHLLDYRYEKTGIVEEFYETRDVTIRVRTKKPRRIVTHPGEREPEWIERNGAIEFRVPPFNMYTAVVIET